MSRRWTKIMENFIRDKANEYTDEQISEFLNQYMQKLGKKPFTPKAVRRRRQRMGIVKKCGRGICEVVDYEN